MIPSPQMKTFCGLLPRITQYFWPWEWEFIPDYWAKNWTWYKSYQCFMVLLKTHEYCQFYIHCLLFLMSWQHLCLHCLMTGDCPSAGFSLKSIAWVFCHNSDSDNYRTEQLRSLSITMMMTQYCICCPACFLFCGRGALASVSLLGATSIILLNLLLWCCCHTGAIAILKLPTRALKRGCIPGGYFAGCQGAIPNSGNAPESFRHIFTFQW